MKTKTFKFITTPSHGYLVVPNKIIKPYIQHLVDIDRLVDVAFSFWNRKSCQLEEDSELGMFVEWFESENDVKVVYNESHQESIRKHRQLSFIANLDVKNNSNWIL